MESSAGDEDGRAGGDVGDLVNAVAVEAEGLVVDQARGDQVRAVGLVEVVQVRGVLEVVGVELAVLQSGVGQNVVVVDHDLEVIAFGSERVLDLFEDLGVRGGAGADHDLDGLGRGGGGSFRSGRGGSRSGGRGWGRRAAGGERENDDDGQKQSVELFHCLFLLIDYIRLFTYFY